MLRVFNFKKKKMYRKRRTLKLIYLWISLIIGAFFLKDILLPFFLAIFFSYTLNPIIVAICRIKIANISVPRWCSIVFVYFFISALFYFFSIFFIPKIYSEFIRLTGMATNAINQIDENTIKEISFKIERFLKSLNLPVDIVISENENFISKDGAVNINIESSLKNSINKCLFYVREQSSQIIVHVQLLVKGIIGFIFKSFLTFMITAFILLDTENIKKIAIGLVSEEGHEKFNSFLQSIDDGLSGVVRGQIAICAVNAALTFVGLFLFNVKFSLILATMAGVLSLIPIFGTIISTVPITLVALTSSVASAFFILCWILGVHLLEANLLNPKIMGNAAKMHPVLIVLALMAGESFFGIVGALVAIPIASIIRTIFCYFLLKIQDSKKVMF